MKWFTEKPLPRKHKLSHASVSLLLGALTGFAIACVAIILLVILVM